MGIGTSIFLIAIGAILRYAVADGVKGIDLPVVGLILMIAGVLGLAFSLLYANLWARDRATAVPVDRERTVVRDREVL